MVHSVFGLKNISRCFFEHVLSIANVMPSKYIQYTRMKYFGSIDKLSTVHYVLQQMLVSKTADSFTATWKITSKWHVFLFPAVQLSKYIPLLKNISKVIEQDWKLFSLQLTSKALMLWLSRESNSCHFNCATFRMTLHALARSLCCLSKEFASKKRKKFLDGKWSEGDHGKRKVA